MYKIIKATGHDGTDKLPQIAEVHSLEGKFLWIPQVDGSFGFLYNDNSGKIRSSSKINEIVWENSKVIIKTQNTEYLFERID